MTIDTFLALVLGWLLGLGGHLLLDWNARGRSRKALRKAFVSELAELRYRLACAVFYVEMHLGTLTQARIGLLVAIFRTYQGPQPSEHVLPLAEALADLADDQLPAHWPGDKKHTAPSLRRYYAPLLDSRLADLHNFDADTQAILLEIHAHLGMFNDIADRAQHYHDLTFQNLEGQQHQNVIGNLKEALASAARAGTTVLERIGRLPEFHG